MCALHSYKLLVVSDMVNATDTDMTRHVCVDVIYIHALLNVFFSCHINV